MPPALDGTSTMGVLDEETRRNVVRFLGFCVPHALSLSLIARSGFLLSLLGSCIVYDGTDRQSSGTVCEKNKEKQKRRKKHKEHKILYDT